MDEMKRCGACKNKQLTLVARITRLQSYAETSGENGESKMSTQNPFEFAATMLPKITPNVKKVCERIEHLQNGTLPESKPSKANETKIQELKEQVKALNSVIRELEGSISQRTLRSEIKELKDAAVERMREGSGDPIENATLLSLFATYAEVIKEERNRRTKAEIEAAEKEAAKKAS